MFPEFDEPHFFMEPSLCLVICLGILVLFSPDFIWCFDFQCLLILMIKPAGNSSKCIILNHFFKNFLGGEPPNPPLWEGVPPPPTPTPARAKLALAMIVITPSQIFRVFFLTPITCLAWANCTQPSQHTTVPLGCVQLGGVLLGCVYFG